MIVGSNRGFRVLAGSTEFSGGISRDSGGRDRDFVRKGGGTFLGNLEIAADDFEDVGFVKIVDAALIRRLLLVVDPMLALAHHQHAINLSLGVEGLELLFDGLAGVEEACFGFADGSDAGSLLSRHGVLCLLSF